MTSNFSPINYMQLEPGCFARAHEVSYPAVLEDRDLFVTGTDLLHFQLKFSSEQDVKTKAENTTKNNKPSGDFYF